jgi:hypothetical protein
VATVFATVINSGPPQSGCVIAPIDAIPAGFSFQRTDPATNQPVGPPNAPATIAGGAAQAFVVAIAPTQSFEPTDVRLNFQCAASDPAPSVTALDTVLVSAASGPIPDIVALAAAAIVPFEPSQSRVFVRFRDAGGQIRGATSVAVTTAP